MNRVARITGWLSLTVGLTIVFLMLVRVGLEAHSRTKGGMLLTDLKTLQIGDSAGRVEAIVSRNGGRILSSQSGLCEKADSCYGIYAGPPLAFNRAVLRHSLLQRWAGLRPWEVDVVLGITDSRLSLMRLQFSADTGLGQGSLVVRTTLAPASGSTPYYATYLKRPGYLELLPIDITSAATSEERHRAFDFDLSCAIAYSGCRSVCELAPSAWRDYEARPTAGGTPVSDEEANDPRCAK